ncbi:MAG TPA: rhodanese-like domain-containing protein [Acidimicrobiales bacterium]|nr:rhodanese-like domain-containing protein [Acidimicrobiales bacterium]
MAKTIDTDDLADLLDRNPDVQLVEVLPSPEYDDEHLPGALHLPLTKLTRRAATEQLDRSRPVVVYCFDFQ